MNLNKYEMIYIVKPDLMEVKNLTLVNYYKDLIKSNGGRNISVQYCGRRHLSYNILNHYDGFYIQLNYESNGKVVNVIEKAMRFDDKILRYLTVRKQDN